MRASWLFLLLAGCNRVFGLDSTHEVPAEAAVAVDAPPDADTHLDEDLDGIPNDTDNCPGVGNPEQADTSDIAAGGPADGVGDACDPDDSGTHALFARYFFNDMADVAKFSVTPANAFTFHDGYVDVVAGDTPVFLQGLELPIYNRGELTVEAGFEVIDHAPDAQIGVFLDGQNTHRAYVDLRATELLLIASEPPYDQPCMPTVNNPTCGAEPVTTLPQRLVVQLRAGPANPKAGNLKAILAGTGIDVHSDSSGTTSNVFGVVVRNAHVRLVHVLLYTKQ